jgi:hypothetical protein
VTGLPAPCRRPAPGRVVPLKVEGGRRCRCGCVNISKSWWSALPASALVANGSGQEEFDFEHGRRPERDALKDAEEGDYDTVGISLGSAIENQINAGSIDKSRATAPGAVKIPNGTAVRPVEDDRHLINEKMSALVAARPPCALRTARRAAAASRRPAIRTPLVRRRRYRHRTTVRTARVFLVKDHPRG